MASEELLNKIRRAVRRSPSPDVDAEVEDIITACRCEMIEQGVPQSRVYDNDDALVVACIRCYARWQFGIGGEDADRNREDYLLMLENLRRSAHKSVQNEGWI